VTTSRQLRRQAEVPMKINKRERNLLVACVAVVLIAGWMLLSPQSSGTGGATKYSRQVAEQKQLEGKLQLRQMSRDEEALQPRIATTSYDMPAAALQPRVVRDLQEIAARAGVHIREWKPGQPSGFRDAVGASVPMDIRFRTSFQPNLVRFLYYVEDPAGKMVVQKIDVTSTDAKFKTVDVTARIVVFTRSIEGVRGSDTGETSDVDKKTKS
jgi:hypothetical protein